MTWSTTLFDSLAALPPAADVLFADAATGNLFSTREWYRCIIDTALPATVRPCLALCLQDGQPRALFPLERHADGTVQSLTTPYTCLYQPLIAPGAAAARLSRISRRCATVPIERVSSSRRADLEHQDCHGLGPWNRAEPLPVRGALGGRRAHVGARAWAVPCDPRSRPYRPRQRRHFGRQALHAGDGRDRPQPGAQEPRPWRRAVTPAVYPGAQSRGLDTHLASPLLTMPLAALCRQGVRRALRRPHPRERRELDDQRAHVRALVGRRRGS